MKLKNKKLKAVLGGVDPKPVVVEGNSNSKVEEIIKLALRSSRAIDNELFSRNYRRSMISVFLKRSFQQLIDNEIIF